MAPRRELEAVQAETRRLAAELARANARHTEAERARATATAAAEAEMNRLRAATADAAAAGPLRERLAEAEAVAEVAMAEIELLRTALADAAPQEQLDRAKAEVAKLVTESARLQGRVDGMVPQVCVFIFHAGVRASFFKVCFIRFSDHIFAGIFSVVETSRSVFPCIPFHFLLRAQAICAVCPPHSHSESRAGTEKQKISTRAGPLCRGAGPSRGGGGGTRCGAEADGWDGTAAGA
jgi:hypothetical protein